LKSINRILKKWHQVKMIVRVKVKIFKIRNYNSFTIESIRIRNILYRNWKQCKKSPQKKIKKISKRSGMNKRERKKLKIT
jgi:predicted transcriptional regulator